MRRCSKCWLEKRPEEFAVRKDRADGRATICKACHRLYVKGHYASHLDYYAEKGAKARARMRAANLEALLAYLAGHPCVDCGESDVRVLQFDHADPRTKTANVSDVLKSHPWSVAVAEIAKCVVRCANCHRRKTARYRDFDWRRADAIREADGPWVSLTSAIIEARAVSSVDRASAF